MGCRDEVVLGFIDECSSQINSCTRRLWGFGKPCIVKDTDKIHVNAMGFYSVNGVSVLECKDNLRTPNFRGVSPRGEVE